MTGPAASGLRRLVRELPPGDALAAAVALLADPDAAAALEASDPTARAVLARHASDGGPAALAALAAMPVARRVDADLEAVLPRGPALPSPDGGHLVVLAAPERVEVWHRARRRKVWSRDTPPVAGVACVVPITARRVVVSMPGPAGAPDHELVLLEPTGARRLGAARGAVVALGRRADDQVVSVARDGEVAFWPLAGGRAHRIVVPEVDGAPRRVERAEIDPARARAVLVHAGGAVQVVDLERGEVVAAERGAGASVLAPVPQATLPLRELVVSLEAGRGAQRSWTTENCRLRVHHGPARVRLGEVPVPGGSSVAASPVGDLVVLSDPDRRVPTTLWDLRGAVVHALLRRPLAEAVPTDLDVLTGLRRAALHELPDEVRRGLALLDDLLRLRLRDTVEVEPAELPVVRAPGPHDIELDDA